MSKKIRVGVIFGGRSGEHEVSLVSASSVIKYLDKTKYEVVPIGITKEGRWISSGDAMEMLKDGNNIKGPFSTLPAEPNRNQLVPIDGESKENGPKLDVIFPVLHGTFGEDGTVQGLLELAGLPYVGCGVLASAVGMDKAIQKALFRQAGLPVVDYIVLTLSDWEKKRPETASQAAGLGFPVFVKPANLGSSVGISKVHGPDELPEAIELALKYDQKILIEKGVDRARELECSVLGNEDVKASVAGEIVPSNEFYDYEAKYVDGKSKAIIPAEISSVQLKKIQAMAISAFQAIGGSGMARVDFLMDRSNPDGLYLNEVNTIPGFTSISMYPKLWEASGLSYGDLLDRLVSLAIERHQKQSKLIHSYTPKAAWHKKS